MGGKAFGDAVRDCAIPALPFEFDVDSRFSVGIIGFHANSHPILFSGSIGKRFRPTCRNSPGYRSPLWQATKRSQSRKSCNSCGLYEKDGLRITVGFYQDKSCYEQFQKIDPKNPNSYVELSETERSQLIDANCKSCGWHGHAEPTSTSDGRTFYLTTYKLSNELVSAVCDGDKKVFTIRSLVVENQNAEIEKKRQQENLKGF